MASLRGGPLITIAESGTGRSGGSWGTDGYLYFDGDLPRRRAGACGGTGADEELIVVENFFEELKAKVGN